MTSSSRPAAKGGSVAVTLGAAIVAALIGFLGLVLLAMFLKPRCPNCGRPIARGAPRCAGCSAELVWRR